MCCFDLCAVFGPSATDGEQEPLLQPASPQPIPPSPASFTAPSPPQQYQPTAPMAVPGSRQANSTSSASSSEASDTALLASDLTTTAKAEMDQLRAAARTKAAAAQPQKGVFGFSL